MTKHVWMVISLCAGLIAGSLRADELEKNFTAPPDAFKPWVFFFFENQTMDPPGITADLESLKSVGIGGLIAFVEQRKGMKSGPVKTFSKEYDAGMQHFLDETERLGFTVSLHNCDGSATAGGPWNSAEHSMKQFVWNETVVQGGSTRTLKLNQPLTVEKFYRDTAVTAYPFRRGLRLPIEPKVSSPDGNVNWACDGNLLTPSSFFGSANKQREIRFEYAEPVTVARIFFFTSVGEGLPPVNYRLESSEDGTAWSKVTDGTQKRTDPVLADFPEVTGRYFRVLVSSPKDYLAINDIDLLPSGGRPRAYPQFTDWAFATGRMHKKPADPFLSLLQPGDTPLDPAQMLDLTAQMKPDGSLTCNLPEGEWLVIRTGYTTTGKKNHPAEAEGMGFEVDKFDPQLVRRHAETGFPRMSGGNTSSSLNMLHVDSWEAGGQTWSANIEAEFERRNGYAMRPYLPALGGRLVTDIETTRRFLEDYQRTQQDLVAENFYGVMREYAHEKGLKLLSESTQSRIYVHRPLDIFSYVDIPAGEAWASGNFSSKGDLSAGLRDAVSAAHILNKPFTPVEVFTSTRSDWNIAPRYLKPFGDKILAAGGNQLTLHCYLHQPTDAPAPGWTMLRYGTTFNRHVTWWNEAKPWIQSMSRSQVMLRQGRTVTDICRLLADNESLAKYENQPAFWDAPSGFANDWMTSRQLLNLSVEKGALVNSSGSVRYRLLVLPESDRMMLETVKKLHELVEAGAVILGPRPVARVGLRGGEAADKEFDRHVAALWGNEKTATDRRVGQGRVLTGMTVEAALAALNTKPDIAWIAADSSQQIDWHHRNDGSRDIYFVANGSSNAFRATLSFRVAGRAPEIWYPESGKILKPALFRSANQRTEIPVALNPAESIVVVFGPEAAGAHFESAARNGQPLWPEGKAPAEGLPSVWLQPGGKAVAEAVQPGEYIFGKSAPVSVAALPAPMEIRGPWQVDFQGVEAPKPQVFEQLIAWNKHTDPSVRFFSGSAAYRTVFDWKPETGNFKSENILDLGEVRELAEVTLNGESLGVLWKPPFSVDVTGRLRPGKNEIVIRAVNTWANRMIGDLARPEGERKTWTSYSDHYKKTDALPDSGLLGPVTLKTAVEFEVKP